MITISVRLLLHFSRATLLCIILGLVSWLWLLKLLLKINDSSSTEKKILSNWHNIIYIKSRQCAMCYTNVNNWGMFYNLRIKYQQDYILNLKKKDLILLCNSLNFLHYWYNPPFSSSFYSSFMELMPIVYVVSNCKKNGKNEFLFS